MQSHRAFTAVDTLVLTIVLGLGILLTVVVLDPFGSRRSHRNRRPENDWRIAEISKMLGLYGSTNKDWYPGFHKTGTANTEPGTTLAVEDRVRIMLQGSYFTPEFVVSPLENDPAIRVYQGQPNDDFKGFTASNFSYAMLQVPTHDSGRRTEWAFTSNSQAVILGDRATSLVTPGASIHDAAKWRGSVGWNDGHAGFENQWDGFTTKYGKMVNDANDNLFFGGTDNDALLIHNGN